MPLQFPRSIRTERLLLRPWRVSEAARLKAVIDENLEHLRAWMPWAMDEPSPLDVIAARIEKFTGDFAAGIAGGYTIFTPDEATVLGGAGLHPLSEDGAEIGFWLARAHTGRGYATEAARALVEVAFANPGIERVQIRCDPRNERSAAVPRRLGFRHIETLRADTVAPTGVPRDTMVWQVTRREFLEDPAG
ncbi:MAG TPA: GNAT family N-acetyltransferase [Gemmatimonadaceae bacterium]|nr:GNAT family N-acetyltransferase [Gemmatimonadaceae bacterium]